MCLQIKLREGKKRDCPKITKQNTEMAVKEKKAVQKKGNTWDGQRKKERKGEMKERDIRTGLEHHSKDTISASCLSWGGMEEW